MQHHLKFYVPEERFASSGRTLSIDARGSLLVVEGGHSSSGGSGALECRWDIYF